jgi:hypothetical protein
MNDFMLMLVFAIIGFFLGGLLGVAFDGGWFPDAWYGALALGFGVVVVENCH